MVIFVHSFETTWHSKTHHKVICKVLFESPLYTSI